MKTDESTKKDSENGQGESSKERLTLTDYHWERRKAAQKEAEEMSKHPYSLEEKRAQVARKYARREEDRGKF